MVDGSLEFLRNIFSLGIASMRRKSVKEDPEDEVFEPFDASVVVCKISDEKTRRFVMLHGRRAAEFTLRCRCVNNQGTKCGS